VSHRKTIPLPGYAGRLDGRGGYHRRAGLVEEVCEPHAVAALPAPARRKTPFSGPASPRGYRSRLQREYRSFTVLPRPGTALACGHQYEEMVITMAAPDPGTSRSSSASSRATWARRSRPATSLSATGWACTTRAGGGRTRDRGGTGRPHGHRCLVRQRVVGRPGGRRMCLLRPRPWPASRLRVQHSGNLSAKVVTRPGPDTRRQQVSGPRRPAHRRTHLQANAACHRDRSPGPYT
jgi:hypothetical protein